MLVTRAPGLLTQRPVPRPVIKVLAFLVKNIVAYSSNGQLVCITARASKRLGRQPARAAAGHKQYPG